MADFISSDLIARMAEWVLGIDGTLPTLQLRLFVNAVAITDCTNVIGDFTQCTAPGYAAVNLTPLLWVGAVVACFESDVYPPITFTMTGPGAPGQTIRGHYVVDTASGQYWWGATWDTPFVLPALGGAGQSQSHLGGSTMLCVTSDGAVALLNRLLDGIPTLFHLYINNVPRSTDTVLTDFVEADWPVYRPIFDRRWSPALWVVEAAFSWTDQKTWIRGSGGVPRNVYGYYVTIGRPKRLLWYEPREAGPVPMILPTDCVTITPQISYRGPPT